jgi:hypothetical protein
MFFATLVLLSAFLIEGIGTYVSVVGLSSLFAANPVIIVLAIALDVGKVVTVSFLYKHWKKVNVLMKTYMTIAAIVLMGITSAGAFGYLSAQFQKAIVNTNESGVLIASLTDEQGRLQKRKEEIDAQISKLPDNMVAGRKALFKQFAPEVDRINVRLVEIDTKLPELKIATLHQNVEVGPIIYIAEAFNTTPEKAVKWVILIIIFVFDPLAIALLLSGNFLIERRDIDANEALSIVSDDEDDTPKVVPAKEANKHPDPAPFFNGEMSSPLVSTASVGTPPPMNGNYFIQSPTQAMTSWTSTTTYDELPEAVEVADTKTAIAEPAVEEEPLEEIVAQPVEEREVIKLEQLQKHPEPKLYRSMLEDFGTHSDIEADVDSRRNLQALRKTYSDPGDAVTVGGPF